MSQYHFAVQEHNSRTTKTTLKSQYQPLVESIQLFLQFLPIKEAGQETSLNHLLIQLIASTFHFPIANFQSNTKHKQTLTTQSDQKTNAKVHAQISAIRIHSNPLPLNTHTLRTQNSPTAAIFLSIAHYEGFRLGVEMKDHRIYLDFQTL
jgi:hypothetical protein